MCTLYSLRAPGVCVCMCMQVLVYASFSRAYCARRDFMVSSLLRAIKNRRIEQVEQVCACVCVQWGVLSVGVWLCCLSCMRARSHHIAHRPPTLPPMAQEKERLDYERQLLASTVRRGSGRSRTRSDGMRSEAGGLSRSDGSLSDGEMDMAGVGQAPPPPQQQPQQLPFLGTACSPAAPGTSSLGVTFAAGSVTEAGAASSTAASAGAAGGEPASASSKMSLRRGRGRPHRTFDSAASVASFASSAADELTRALGHAPPLPPRSGVCELLRAGELPLFFLLPQFYGEACNGGGGGGGGGTSTGAGGGGGGAAGVTYLHAEEARRPLQLRAAPDGRLIDSHGEPLARGRLMHGMYVMDRDGVVMLSFDDEGGAPPGAGGGGGGAPSSGAGGVSTGTGGGDSERRYFHHSSIVAGGPVAAAGGMSVCDGRLLTISNDSGHYMPPPSTLRTVLARLTEMGVRPLHSVRVELVEPKAEMTPLSQETRRPFEAAPLPRSSALQDDERGLGGRPRTSPAKVRPRAQRVPPAAAGASRA